MDAQRSVSPERVEGSDLLAVALVLAELTALTWEEPVPQVPVPRAAHGDALR